MKYRSLISDAELEQELLTGIKTRNLEQKFLYMDEGADLYYRSVEEKKSEEVKAFSQNNINNFIKAETQQIKYYPDSDFYKNFMQHRSYRKYPHLLMSLGCGNGMQEKSLLEWLDKTCPHTEYLGIDSSRRMLELAYENLRKISTKKDFIHADITKSSCIDYLKNMLPPHEIRILGFLGGSFCNPNQTEITNSLYNIMGKNDLLRIDLVSRKQKDPEEERNLVTRYLGYLEKPQRIEKNSQILLSLGIPIENGKFKLAFQDEETIGATTFKYYFEFTEKTSFEFHDQKHIFLKGDFITLLHIRIYHEDPFLQFMKEHEFQLIDKTNVNADRPEKAQLNQYLFKKAGIKSRRKKEEEPSETFDYS